MHNLRSVFKSFVFIALAWTREAAWTSQVKDPSLLRFMVDLRGADLSDKQLRDDLMTMLIAGHETTAAVLTWALFCLLQNQRALDKAVSEIDQVLPDWSTDEMGKSPRFTFV